MVVKAEQESGHRARQARATREQVAAAARRLFGERGYVATTMAAISEESGVPAQTIYSALGSKAGVLEEIRRQWIDESGAAQSHRDALDEDDLRARLRMAAGWHRRQMELGYDVITIYQEAARSDPTMTQEWRRVQKTREGAVTELVGSLRSGLSPDLDLQNATDIYVALTLPELYRTLVIDRRWSLDRYERWLAEALIDQLLG